MADNDELEEVFKMKDNLEKKDLDGWLFPPSREFVSEKEIYIDPAYKKDLEKIIITVKHPEIFGTELGYGGVLLKGPQGAGKTYFARHIACLADADFVLVKYLPDPRFVIKLFEEARKRAENKPQILFM